MDSAAAVTSALRRIDSAEASASRSRAATRSAMRHRVGGTIALGEHLEDAGQESSHHIVDGSDLDVSRRCAVGIGD